MICSYLALSLLWRSGTPPSFGFDGIETDFMRIALSCHSQGRGVELLFGLDMLKRYQACIDLSKNALVIQGREIRFLSEHELPRNGLEEELEVDE